MNHELPIERREKTEPKMYNLVKLGAATKLWTTY